MKLRHKVRQIDANHRRPRSRIGFVRIVTFYVHAGRRRFFARRKRGGKRTRCGRR